ncbi:unnamed protein product [Linum trigynum]|uniref:NAB domain-containing protein n=1 Tax=Linum trigynum TaxID=586398 RepID=A0AAV2FBW8_9ROSI
MLQRAASNAYSWWWASHIRTKQSKWLEENLQDMEDKVGQMLSIIENEGDSFVKRVEMYYKQRPELINHVEDSYRAYRALAERYDHLSKDLQSANRTIATVFPESVQFYDDDEDDASLGETPTLADDGKPFASPKPPIGAFPKKVLRTQSTLGSHHPNHKPALMRSITSFPVAASSGFTKEEALEEIDKLQKEILSLQTEKEFVQSICDRCNAKCGKIENRVSEIQERIHKLQDEFDISNVLDDGEARSLMATTALRSCKDALVKLQRKQDQSVEDANVENSKIKAVQKKFINLKGEILKNSNEQMETIIEEEEEKEEEVAEEEEEKEVDQEKEEGGGGKHEEEEEEKADLDEVESLKKKIRKELEKESPSIVTVMQLADKIDQLVEKVAVLETEVSSQGALVRTLKSSTEKLEARVTRLEEEKEAMKQNSEMVGSKLKDFEDELNHVKLLNQTIQEQNNHLQADFAKTNNKIEHLSRRLKKVELRETEEASGQEMKSKPNSINENNESSETGEEKEEEEEDEPNWKKMLKGDRNEREKVMREEYTNVLRSYKDVRRKLGDVEKKSKDGFFELSLQIRELKNAIANKDEEILSLRKNEISSPIGGATTNLKVSPAESIANMIGYPESDLPSYCSPAQTHTARKRPSEEEPSSSPLPISVVEQKIRSEIDNLLEENLEFWLRFSTSFHQIRKFQNSVHDLKGELAQLMDNKRADGTGKIIPTLIQDARPIYKHLKEIQNELSLWLENIMVLKDELDARSKSLCGIEDELAREATDTGENELSEYQAAKFQGELMNMKQEGSKVGEELHMGLERVKALKADIDRVVLQLDVEIGAKQRSFSKPRIPLRSFLFGVKLKKKTSMFSCVSPALDRQFSDLEPRPRD